jgi:trypsin
MPRIINGENAEEGAYPFFASLTQGGEHSCGGTLIAPDMILTAAHCKGLEQAELGRDVRVDPNDEYETFDLIQEFRHPAYSDETYLFDFMVVKLDRPAPSSYPIIRLNQDREQPPIGVPDGVKAIGFGVTEYYYDGSHNGAAGILQEVDLHVITNEECEKSRGTGNIQDEYTAGYDGLITPDMLCAEDDFQDTCAGKLHQGVFTSLNSLCCAH